MVRKGRSPCCDKTKVKRGPWSPAEDARLISFIHQHGHTNWRALPQQAGLLRCGKSCRLRWINYLRPDVKRGNFSPEEEETIIRLHKSMGNKWSMIAAQLPGRTDNEIKNVWNTHLKKKFGKNNGATSSDLNRSKDSSTTGYSSSSGSSCISISNSNGDMITSNSDKGSPDGQQFPEADMEGDQNQEPNKEDSLSPHHSNISTNAPKSLIGVGVEEEPTSTSTDTKEEGKVSDEKVIFNGISSDSDVEFWSWFESLINPRDEHGCEFGGEEHYEHEGESQEIVGEGAEEYKKWLKELENELGLSEGTDGGEHREESGNDLMFRSSAMWPSPPPPQQFGI